MVDLSFGADENFAINHAKHGLLSMVNYGKDNNGSQFFIHMDANHFLDGSNVVFGELFLVSSPIRWLNMYSGEVSDEASMRVLREMEQMGGVDGRLKVESITVSKCGIV